MSQHRLDLHILLDFSICIYFPEIFTEIGWMLENINFSIAPNNNFNVRNLSKIANVLIV